MTTLANPSLDTPSPRPPRSRNFWKKQALSYLVILPTLLIFAVMTFGPILTTIVYSFQEVNLTRASEWVGLHNYVRMFGNPLFYTAWKNIAVFLIISILMGFMVPVFLALMVNELRHFGRFFQTIVYLPSLIPIAVALLVWRQIYAPDGGVLNSLLNSIGLPAQLWLQNPDLAKPAIVVIMTWLGAGGSVLIYLSALQEIPTEIYEAAELDGFSPWQRIWYITLPLISSRMQIMLLLQIIVVGQVFTEPFILTTGGPANSTVTPVLELYRTAFERSDFGLASAWSVSLLVVLSLFSIVYVRLSLGRESIQY
ncbi:MAG: sugar ABC transporter permease [Anaerolineales bacterium]|nr:sugar ABC transporter permease [Anaerolineales bacterium]